MSTVKKQVPLDDDDGLEEPNAETAAKLDQISKDIDEGVNISGPFYTADEFLEDLKK